jgi:hypothetical protein
MGSANAFNLKIRCFTAADFLMRRQFEMVKKIRKAAQIMAGEYAIL